MTYRSGWGRRLLAERVISEDSLVSMTEDPIGHLQGQLLNPCYYEPLLALSVQDCLLDFLKLMGDPDGHVLHASMVRCRG